MKFIKFPSMAAGLGIAVIAILAVAVASGTGVLSPATKIIGRTIGGIKSWLLKLIGIERRKGNGNGAVAALVLMLAGLSLAPALLAADSVSFDGFASGAVGLALVPDLWRLKKLVTRKYPVVGNLVAHAPASEKIDLKDFLQGETISELWVRVVGTYVVAGAGVGTATGKENPEALLISAIARHTPSLGIIGKSNLSARGIVVMRGFDTGYIIRHADQTDAAATKTVDIFYPLRYKQPGSVNPIEWALPLGMFDTYELDLQFGGREQLFTGGTNTADFSGLAVEIWANIDDGVAGQFHLVEEFEQSVPVESTQTDKEVILQKGYAYTHLLFLAEKDNVLINTMIRNINIQSSGREWTPQGDLNAAVIQRWNRDTHINNAAEDLTGVYFVPALRDGMYKRAIDAMDQRLQIKLDVVRTTGVERVIIRGRRIKPLALNVPAR